MEDNSELTNIPDNDDTVDFSVEENLSNCKNCDNYFPAEYDFCPYCGQKDKDDLTLGVLFYNTISNYFSFDARFLRSFIPLMFKPGYVARQFVLGRRLQYLHPAQYYLFVSVLFFFFFSFKAREYNATVDKALKQGFESDMIIDTLDIKADSVAIANVSEQLKKNQKFTNFSDEDLEKLDSIMQSENKTNVPNLTFDYDKKKVDSLIAVGAEDPEILRAMGMKENAGFLTKRFYEQLLKFQKNSGGGILQAFFDSIPVALFVLLPIFALILKIFYWRRGRFAHHLVFSFYYFSFLFLVLILILGINFLWEIPDWIDFLVMLSTYLYLVLALRHFYQQGFLLSLIKSWLIGFFYLSFVVPIALGVMVTASFFFY